MAERSMGVTLLLEDLEPVLELAEAALMIHRPDILPINEGDAEAVAKLRREVDVAKIAHEERADDELDDIEREMQEKGSW